LLVQFQGKEQKELAGSAKQKCSGLNGNPEYILTAVRLESFDTKKP
jgi:hypothetical protein